MEEQADPSAVTAPDLGDYAPAPAEDPPWTPLRSLAERPWVWPYGGLAVLVFLVFLPGWFSARQLIAGNDLLLIHYPSQVLFRDLVLSGHLPFWNPYTMNGMPALANPQVGYLYPPHWLLLWLPAPLALNWLLGLHILLAAVGTAWFAGRLGASRQGQFLAGISYGLGSATLGPLYSGHLPWLEAYAWLPLATGLALEIRRRWRPLLLAGVLVAILLSRPEAYVFAFWWVLLWLALALAVRRRLRADGPGALLRLAAAFVIAIAVGAVQVLPSEALVSVSNRAAGVTYAAATAGSLEPWHLLTLLAPTAFGSEANGTYWPGVGWLWHERLLYVGIAPLVAAACCRSRWRWPCWITAAVAVLVSMGSYTPLFGILRGALPVYGSLWMPPRHLQLACLSLAVAAGLGLETVQGRRVALGAFAAAALIAVLGVTFSGWFPPLLDLFDGAPPVTGKLVVTATALATRPLLIGAALMAVLGLLITLLPARWLGWGVLALTVVDLGYVFAPYRIVPTDPAQFLAQSGGGEMQGQSRSAVTGAQSLLTGNFGVVYHDVQPGGDQPLFNVDYSILVTGYYQGGVGFGVTSADASILYLLGYGRIYDTERNLVTVFEPAPALAWVARCVRPGGPLDVRDPKFPRQSCITLQGVSPSNGGGPGRARLLAEGPGSLTAEASGPGWLVTVEPWYPGWSATVDGSPTPVKPADGALVAIRLPPGRHTVALNYFPAGLAKGALVALAGLLLLVLACLWERRFAPGAMQRTLLARWLSAAPPERPDGPGVPP